MKDLLGDELPPQTPTKGRRKDPTPWGYYAPPGTGPDGKHCRDCAYAVLRGGVSGRYYKCAKSRGKWTGGRKTDILLRSPACSGWEAASTSQEPKHDTGTL